MKLTETIYSATQVLVDHLEELTALDQAIGDGDHGLNMKRGAQAIQSKLSTLEGASLNVALDVMGKSCIAMVGGSSGPVFGTLLITLGKELPPEPTPEDLANGVRAAIEALTRLGKAQVGQKTLLDVLDPVQKVLAAGGDDIVQRVKKCALESAAATADMEATRGRSSFLGDRAKGHIDPGSRSMALIIGAICDTL